MIAKRELCGLSQEAHGHSKGRRDVPPGDLWPQQERSRTDRVVLMINDRFARKILIG